jgi:hypothetical protein
VVFIHSYLQDQMENNTQQITALVERVIKDKCMKCLTINTEMGTISITLYVDKEKWEVPFVVVTNIGMGKEVDYGISIDFTAGKELFKALKEAAISHRVLMILANINLNDHSTLANGLMNLGFVRATKHDDYAFAPLGIHGSWTNAIHTMMRLTRDAIGVQPLNPRGIDHQR